MANIHNITPIEDLDTAASSAVEVVEASSSILTRALFLDIDGVLNSEDWIISEHKRREHELGIRKPIIDECDPDAVSVLNTLIEKSHAQIVLSSTWRITFGLKRTVDYLVRVGFKYKTAFVGRTPVACPVTRNGTTEWPRRGQEIAEYLHMHPDITSYCILDDDSDMLDEQRKHFVRTNRRTGLVAADIQRCLSAFRVPNSSI